MKVVVDANIIIAGLIRNSATRRLLFDTRLELIAPAFLKQECGKYADGDEIQRKTGMAREQLAQFLNAFFGMIKFFATEEYAGQIQQALKLAVHLEDAPYIAVALKNKCAI